MRILGAALAIAALPLVHSPAPAAAAASACVRPPTRNVDHGSGVMKGSFNLKAGPYAGGSCAVVTRLSAGQVLYFQCWVKNRRGNMWVYARVKGTGTMGWMSVDNLRDIRDTGYDRCPRENTRV
ncbi:hypothetical protein ACIBG8_31705 [Nonomuraea sp. NPDC050556]|uniref:hypothetical protein n=1 Tax=Nonomuraea sp. NPDC050556 TaxID=3364369 RepID=UPI0037B0B00C